jgi:hypothetical protein
MERSKNDGPGYTSPSRQSPGLILFMVDRSLPSTGSTNRLQAAINVVYTQIRAIKDRFQSNNKQETFRFVIMEFANAPQRLNTYYVDDFVENVNVIQYTAGFNQQSIRGTSIKKALDEANNCIEYHLREFVKDTRNSKPPISIIMFSGNPHERSSDRNWNGQFPGVSTPTEYSNNKLDYYSKLILNRDHVFFGVFDFSDQEIKGERVVNASVITENLMKSALSAEERYGVLRGDRIRDFWPDPMDLVGKPFIFPATEFNSQQLSKFLAVMLKLGTFTSTSSTDDDGTGFSKFW